MDQAVIAAIAGTLAAAVTTGLGIYASRKFGLPGLARQLDSEQAELIDTLEGSVKELRAQNADLEQRLLQQEDRRRGCETQIRMVKRDLRDTEAELLELYRVTGKRPPTRLTDHAAEDGR